jgi:hypothetical protein
MKRPNQWNRNRIVKMSFAILIALIIIGFASHHGLDRDSQVVGSSIEATELWHNPWPAPGSRN